MSYQLSSSSAAHTFGLGERLAGYCQPGISILLDGPLAAGKTVFAKGFGRGLGVKENIKSPSFLLMCRYEGKFPFFHFDAYNLGGIDDFYALGFDEFLCEESLVLIEWASVLGRDSFCEYIYVQMDMGLLEEERLLTFTAGGDKSLEILKAWWQHENTSL